MTPSSAPCRSSPSNRPARNCCSSAVAAASKRSSACSRRSAEPLPAIARSASSVARRGADRESRRGRRRRLRRVDRGRAEAELAAAQHAGEPRDRRLALVGRERAQALRQQARTFSLRLRVAATRRRHCRELVEHHGGASFARHWPSSLCVTLRHALAR